MRKLPRPATANPTTSRSKTVASPFEKSRVLRRILALALRSVRRKRSWPEIEGHLSSWILGLHGIRNQRLGQVLLEAKYKDKAVEPVTTLLARVFGPNMDARQLEHLLAASKKLADEKVPKIAEALRQGDYVAADVRFSEVSSNILDAFGVPKQTSEQQDLFSIIGIVKMIRANRATLMCLGLYGASPLTLIARASKGDQRAILDLIKVDKLFLHDQCCADGVRKAELQEDKRFLAKIQRALKYEARIRRRDIQHVYYYILLLLERSGYPLPTLEELWNTVDPLGTEFGSLGAFERDFQRRRKDFAKMIRATDVELSRIKPASPNDSTLR